VVPLKRSSDIARSAQSIQRTRHSLRRCSLVPEGIAVSAGNGRGGLCAGGEIEFFSDDDRSGIRLKMPSWAKSMVESSIAAFLSETPNKNPELVDRALNEVQFRIPPPPPSSDVRSRIEEQFRAAMLGPGNRQISSPSERKLSKVFLLKITAPIALLL
jgi:hypothetical protein